LGDDFDYVCCSAGTGGTLAGIINGISKTKNILGFSSLKGGEFLHQEVSQWLKNLSNNWNIIPDYHFGGYGKTTTALEKFKNNFEKKNHIPLDLVYTAKMVAGVFDLIQKGFFKTGTTLLVIHTGGLQGKEVA
jgi:1-aminocyclopropane-1-carboxylate deaminase